MSGRKRRDEAALFKAVEAVDLAEMRRLLAAGIDPDSRQRGVDHFTPLMQAALAGSLEMVNLLIEHGADVNASDDVGRTPIHLAAWGGSIEVYDLLLAHGADQTRFDLVGDGVLHHAASSGNVELASRLIREGHDPNHVDNTDQTVLDWLAKPEEDAPVEMVELFRFHKKVTG